MAARARRLRRPSARSLAEPSQRQTVQNGVRLLLCALALVLVGCGSRALAGPTPGPVALSATAESFGVRLRLDVDRASLSPGQELWATVTIENTKDVPVRWVGGGCNVPGRVDARVGALADHGRDWEYGFADLKKRLVTVFPMGTIPLLDEAAWSKRASGGQACTADIRVNELRPHAKLTSRFAWDGTISGSPAPSGDVLIYASFDMEDEVAMVGRFVNASVAVQLTGGTGTKVSAARAFDVALEDQRFATWVRARFVARGNSEPAAYDVSGGVTLTGDEWLITATQKTAPAGEIEVRVSAIDGAVRSVIVK
jgi:hypothetical protein